MQGRKYMIEWRKKHMVTIEVAAKNAKVSVYTLRHIEQDDQYVTHPNIAARIAKVYKLTKEQYYGMIPKNHRPGKDYDPDLYAESERDFGTFAVKLSESYYSQCTGDFAKQSSGSAVLETEGFAQAGRACETSQWRDCCQCVRKDLLL